MCIFAKIISPLKTIKQLRSSINKTQKDVAKHLNCTQSTISKIELGTVTGEYYKNYLAYLVKNKVDINQLFR